METSYRHGYKCGIFQFITSVSKCLIIIVCSKKRIGRVPSHAISTKLRIVITQNIYCSLFLTIRKICSFNTILDQIMCFLRTEHPVKELHCCVNLRRSCWNCQTIVAGAVSWNRSLFHITNRIYIYKVSKLSIIITSSVPRVYILHICYVIIQCTNDRCTQSTLKWSVIIGYTQGIWINITCILPLGKLFITISNKVMVPSLWEILEVLIA